MSEKLKFWESDWGDNLGKVSLTNGANEYFKNKNVEYVDMTINTIEKSNGNLYQTFVIAYYDLD
ncbi:hypothetical protein P7H60_11300 [Vagococcus carniphilus]|uniref:hypothetical protein n=1 Tax=Vagococcus carniphilus TaxID=218144 RepID=UPI0028914007|nr:hypothetical protein [Vagococcus carniphilus]MDT2849727.1 hypothetical protein [Vagococcus carniphilus]